VTPFARRARLPLVVLFHGHDISGLEPSSRWTPRYYRYYRQAPTMFTYASALLCASQQLADELILRGAPAAKVRVHRLGVDTQRFAPPDPAERAPRPTVLMVGRLVEKKGMAYGLSAFASVLQRFATAQLRIAGSGPLRRQLRRRATSLGIGEHVEFLGSRTSDEVRREMRRAHLVLAPSVTTGSKDRESGPIVLKEAACCGLPAVASHHGGIPEIVEHERTGLLVPERDVDALARGLGRLLSDERARQRMGTAARRKMEEEYDNRAKVEALERTLLEFA
jgi:glycosyltransferase involved in cell wall biosynthesis